MDNTISNAAKILQRLRLCFILNILFLLIAVSGCANLNCTRLEGVLGGKTDLVDFSYKIAEDLIQTAVPPLIPRSDEMPVLVTTFVSNSDLEKTSSFGRLLQEHLGSRLVQLGYTVKELKLANNLYIEAQSGETILTRDLSQLNPNMNAQAIVVGTFTRTNRILYLSARLINPANNNIISSNDYKLCMDDDILAMFGLRQHRDDGGTVAEPNQPILNKIF